MHGSHVPHTRLTFPLYTAHISPIHGSHFLYTRLTCRLYTAHMSTIHGCPLARGSPLAHIHGLTGAERGTRPLGRGPGRRGGSCGRRGGTSTRRIPHAAPATTCPHDDPWGHVASARGARGTALLVPRGTALLVPRAPRAEGGGGSPPRRPLGCAARTPSGSQDTGRVALSESGRGRGVTPGLWAAPRGAQTRQYIASAGQSCPPGPAPGDCANSSLARACLPQCRALSRRREKDALPERPRVEVRR